MIFLLMNSSTIFTVAVLLYILKLNAFSDDRKLLYLLLFNKTSPLHKLTTLFAGKILGLENAAQHLVPCCLSNRLTTSFEIAEPQKKKSAF